MFKFSYATKLKYSKFYKYCKNISLTMKNINLILKRVLEEIEPDKKYQENIFLNLNLIIKKINKGQKIARAVLGGSGAKGTWLKTFDADIFINFNYKKYNDKSDSLSDLLEKLLKKRFKNIIRLHGSRDYFQIKQGGFTFEIIPILEIKKAENAKNITDVSPLHSKWVKKHKALINDMKLTKQFCHAQNVYGAESYIRGFSGYVCEIITAYYGSFLNLVKNAAKWSSNENSKGVIDVQKYYKFNEIFKLVNTSKLGSPLIVIDPVQKDRNAAASLSIEKFEIFKNSSKEFLKNPSNKFFVKKDLYSSFLDEKYKNKKLIKISLKPLDGKTDVIGGKLLKVYEFFKKELQKNGFRILKTDWEWDKKTDALLYFLFEKEPLEKTVEVEGPPIEMEEHVKNFKKIHKNIFVKSNRIFAKDQRKSLLPEELLRKLSKEEFVKDRSKLSYISVSVITVSIGIF